MAYFGLRKLENLKIFADRGCFALLLAVIVSNVYRHYVLDATDPYKCGALLNDGQWLDSSDHGPYHIWQPPGCMFHEYTTPDIAQCMENRMILFVGDATVRHTFWSAVRKIDADWVFEEQARWDIPQGDVDFSQDGVSLKFIWDPWLNSTALHEELERFRARQILGRQIHTASSPQRSGFRNGTTSLIVIGGGMWHARHLQSGSLERFKKSVDAIVSAAYPQGLSTSSRIPPYDGDGSGDQIFFQPIIEPRYERLSPSREGSITPDKINNMNDYLQELSTKGHSVLWAQTKMTRNRPRTYGESGLHVIENVSKRIVDVVLNAHCNSHHARKESILMDRTCCMSYKPPNWIQMIGLVGFFWTLPYAAVAIARSTKLPITPEESASRIPVPLLTLLFCLGYCFLADRIQIFDKVPKQYVTEDFRIILAIVILPCLLTIKGSSTSTIGRRSSSLLANNPSFLSRKQFDEFKGWMQIFILVYGYTRSEDILDFYEVLRVFLAFYLFLFGYGHTMYFLRTDDFSLRRIVAVLLRLNLLTVLLCFAMARPYTSYYFVSLVSFWFPVIFVTLRISRHRNASFRRLLGKVLSSATLITGFVHTPGILEAVCSAIDLLFHANLNAEEWRSALGVDLYIVNIGMLAAIAHIRICAIFNMTESQRSDVHDFIHDCFGGLQVLAIVASVIILPVFWTLTRRSPDREDYDWWMPFVSWLPILSIIVLRNATSFLRSHHCAAFAWIGRRSLAFYVLSQHMWMAGDSEGLLRLFRGGDGSLAHDRWRELVVLTPILVWCACKASDASAAVNAWTLGERVAYRDEGLENGLHKRSTSEIENPSGMKSDDSRLSKDAKRRLLGIAAAVWVAGLTT
ncbi:10 TM acyl transferase domain found in Cas1p-domain-containing protein [Lophiotrema nucula]|uniref:10 TM acyl transferase domain found in Cas1p-domain-containing protein n=1 Tax=Lophiotrema nucula TaxID=690887 RepID=A0A6A5ZPK7_9PLEO|nr:10 TM acyl transferase domain found in Cas1p-domain-containing protein [Lophiotrema nucula]